MILTSLYNANVTYAHYAGPQSVALAVWQLPDEQILLHASVPAVGHGYAYEVWRVEPDTWLRDFLSKDEHSLVVDDGCGCCGDAITLRKDQP